MTRTLPILIPLVLAAGAMVMTLCVAQFTPDGMRVPLWWMGAQGLAVFFFAVAIANLRMDLRHHAQALQSSRAISEMLAKKLEASQDIVSHLYCRDDTQQYVLTRKGCALLSSESRSSLAELAVRGGGAA